MEDFNSGSHDGTIATGEGGGALQLAPGFVDEFDSTSLSSHWGVGAWSSGNSIAVGAGKVVVQGSQVISVATFAEKAVEASIDFGAATYQHFGLASGLDSVAGNYWAIFSTAGTTTNLFARVNATGVLQDFDLGPLPEGFHTYRIEPNEPGFSFYVDGALKATTDIAFPGGTQLRIAFSSFNGSPSPSLDVDWVRVPNYASTGTFTSTVFDAGASVSWQSINWTAVVPEGTSIKIEVSFSGSPDSGFSTWSEVTNGGALPSTTARYIKYRVTFTTTDDGLSPKLFDILFSYL